MNGIFNLNNRFWTFIQKMIDVILLGLLALVFCIPIVTIVPSITALYYVVLKIVTDTEGRTFRDFFKSFRQNFKQGALLSLIVSAAIGFVAYDIRYYNQSSGTIGGIFFFAYCAAGILLLCMLLHLFPLLARFETTPMALFKNSFILVFRYFRWTLLMLAIMLAYIVSIYTLPPMPLLLFGVWVYVNCCIETPILRDLEDNRPNSDTPQKPS